MTNYVKWVTILILFPVFSQAQAPELKFRKIGFAQGLSNVWVDALIQDKKGFIWIGTRNGLDRYDGSQIKVYSHIEADSTSLSDNVIRCIYEDKQHNLWVGTANGLNLLDRNTDSFIRYKNRKNDPRSLSSNVVNSICEDGPDKIWIATTGGGVNLLSKSKGSFSCFRSNSGARHGISSNNIYCLFKDASGRVWAGTDAGLNLFDRQKETFLPVTIVVPNKQRDVDFIRNIQEDQNGNLWLGTNNSGVIIFNPNNRTFKQYTRRPNVQNSLSGNEVGTLLADGDGKIWVGLVNDGLNLYDPVHDGFFHYNYDFNDPNSLAQQTVSAICKDRQGNLWVGTHHGGLSVYVPDAHPFNLFLQGESPATISSNDVKSFCQDKNGRIWIGTDGGGLNLYDPRNKTFKRYKHDPKDKNSISSNAVMDIFQDRKGTYWISTWNGGLDIFDPVTGKFTALKHDPNDPESISSDFVQKVYEDIMGNLWVASYLGGLDQLDRLTRKFRHITKDPQGRTVFPAKNVTGINGDQRGNVWFGTDDAGLIAYNLTARHFTRYFQQQDPQQYLRVVFIDHKGQVWVGQKGLYLFDPKKNDFSIFTKKAGLDEEYIQSILEDRTGNLWIATPNSIKRLNTRTYAVKNFNVKDGLQPGEFEVNAALRAANGEMFFGGSDGLNTFYPDSIRTNRFVPPVYITGFQIFNKPVLAGEHSPLKSDILITRDVVLNYNQSSVSFDFAALNFVHTENNVYAYKLENFDNDWNTGKTGNKAVYTNLNPGNYIFRVRASNNDGLWNNDGATLRITIKPPFWLTWWFLTLASSAVLLTLYWLFEFRRNLALHKLEEEKKEEIHQLQLQFFTNISHEFRTPLSLILGPIEKLRVQEDQSANSRYYTLIYKNARRLTTLINELMDFRKVESGIIRLKVRAYRISGFLMEIADEFMALAEEKQIRFDIINTGEQRELWFDHDVLEKILFNLLNNAFKYTQPGGQVSLEIFYGMDSFKPRYENEFVIKNAVRAKNYFYLKIADTGVGISKESIDHIFERYYRVSGGHLGSGVGLAFVRSLTELHLGDIYVFSEKQKGTEIIIALPLNGSDYKNENIAADASSGDGVLLESLVDHHPVELSAPDAGIPGHELLLHIYEECVLIVEDNVQLRSFLKETLSEYYEVMEAENGLEGLVKAKEFCPDLIISDVMMPEMNGIELCNAVKNDVETSHIPFILLTAKDSIEAQIEGISSGADIYFAKPFSTTLLLLTIRNTFDHQIKLRTRYVNDYFAEAKGLVNSTKDKEFIEKLTGIIEYQLINPELDMDYLAQEIGMSRSRLYQKIRKITGQSIVEFVRSYRLRMAAQIMTHEDIPLSDVIFRVGIQTQSYFTKCFKKEFGKTPTQFLQDINKVR